MTPPSVPFDPVYLGDIFEAGGEAFARDVVNTFLVEAARRQEALHAAIAAADWTAAALAAHAIVSGASMLGLSKVSEVARQVEHVAQEQREPARRALGELDEAILASRGLLATAIAGEARRRESAR